MTYVLGLVVGGLVIGALARLLVPGRQPLGCLGTLAVGIGGSLLGGLVGRALFDRREPMMQRLRREYESSSSEPATIERTDSKLPQHR